MTRLSIANATSSNGFLPHPRLDIPRPRFDRNVKGVTAATAVKRIDHSKSYAEKEVSTNHAESFFSRLRRAEIGTHHHIAGPYIGAYAGESSWREDNRRVSNGEQFLTIVAAGLHHSISRQWKGYWQRRKAA